MKINKEIYMGKDIGYKSQECKIVKYFDNQGNQSKESKKIEEKGDVIEMSSDGDVYKVDGKYYLLQD